MKFRRPTLRAGDTAKETVPQLNLKTIDNKTKKAANKKPPKGVHFKLLALEEKENHRRLLQRRRPPPPPPPADASAPLTSRRPEDVLSERMAQGLSLWSGGADNGKASSDCTEAKPIAKPVLSFMGPQNYFKRSFSMRAKATQPLASGEPATDAGGEPKTATIRRAFGKSLTSKRICLLFLRNCSSRWNCVVNSQETPLQ